MGCDIHYVIEVKDKERDRWVGIFSTDEPLFGYIPWDQRTAPQWMFKDRDYEFFGRLAGVRREGPDPLGLPDDISDLARMHFPEDGDLHSHSYGTLREVWMAKHDGDEEAIAAAMRVKIENGEDPIAKAFGVEEGYGPTLDDIRVVYCFDN